MLGLSWEALVLLTHNPTHTDAAVHWFLAASAVEGRGRCYTPAFLYRGNSGMQRWVMLVLTGEWKVFGCWRGRPEWSYEVMFKHMPFKALTQIVVEITRSIIFALMSSFNYDSMITLLLQQQSYKINIIYSKNKGALRRHRRTCFVLNSSIRNP